jgi:hypothetical protein
MCWSLSMSPPLHCEALVALVHLTTGEQVA